MNYPPGVLAVFYLLLLCYLFFGVQIIADKFMDAIEKLTSIKVPVKIQGADGSEQTKLVPFWNATVANLTLMALGSSAPEIILAVLDTLQGLGECPGELGAATIVGSAAFNLLVISGVCVYAVKPDPKKPEDAIDEETGCKNGVKRIKDLGVFSVTTFSSLFAYVWLWICLLDMQVDMTEAILTFVFFPTLVITCYSIDCYNASQEEKKQDGDDDVVLKYTYVEVMRELIKEKTSGGKDLTPEEEQKKKEMKRYLRETMGTDKVDEINPDELKQKMEGVSLVSRVQYRKAVGLSKTRPTVAKGEVAKFENLHADNLD